MAQYQPEGAAPDEVPPAPPAPPPTGIRCPRCSRSRLRVWITRNAPAKVVRVRVCDCGQRIRTEERTVCTDDGGRSRPVPAPAA